MVNTFHFLNLGPATDFDNVRDIITNFFNVDPPGTVNHVSDFMSSQAYTGNAVLRAYALTDAKPRAVKYQADIAFDTVDAASLPTEVALVFSFQAAAESGLTQKRRRNRIYTGGYRSDANASGRPENSLVETMLFAGKQMLLESQASSSWDWVIYSPTNDDVAVVANGWVDNAWDTQRRRGEIASARGIWNETQPT